MPSIRDEVLEYLRKVNGLTDREITDFIRGIGAPQQPINQACRVMEDAGWLRRERRQDGLTGNYLVDLAPEPLPAQFFRRSSRKVKLDASVEQSGDALGKEMSEDTVKTCVTAWLSNEGWSVQIASGHAHGIDIEARRDSEHWIIEAKGVGSRPEMRGNYFLAVLGSLLQRMSDPDTLYSVALPEHPQFERLWNRLPPLAKQRTAITMLFVSSDGSVRLVG